ncbi:MAG: hypothetical protein M1838_005361, partial [Thelocarpon superellum]
MADRSLTAAIRRSPPVDTSVAYDAAWIKGKTIVVTGGASGFGAGFVWHWARLGANVIIGDINREKGGQLARDVYKGTGNRGVRFVYCDVADWQSQVDFFKSAVQQSEHGGIDVVVANAGIVHAAGEFERPKDLDGSAPPPPDLRTIQVNLVGVLYTAHLALFYLRRNPGSVAADPASVASETPRDRHLLLMGSTAALTPLPNVALYAASKHGVLGLFRSLTATAVAYGVRVNLLCPHYIDTPLQTTISRLLLVGTRMGTIDDVVDAATRLVATPGIVGRALVIGPKLRLEEIRDGVHDGEWSLVDPASTEKASGEEEMAVFEAYAHDYEESDRMLVVLVAAVLTLVTLHLTYSLLSAFTPRSVYRHPVEPMNVTFLDHVAFQPPEPIAERLPDISDTFASYKYRNTCNISSLDLHTAFSPLCHDRRALLDAMSSGGRIGHDAPYMPRGCDMRWFSTEEVCEILGRFEKVIIVGDSMMRHVIGSINVLVRKDLGYGAVTDWNFTPQERQVPIHSTIPKDCFCNLQFNVKACSIQGIFKTADVVKNDPDSLSCPPGTIDVHIEQMIRFPIAPEEIERYKEILGSTKPTKPFAFIFGHGLWNDLDLQASLNWLDEILDTTIAQLPYLSAPHAFWPRLFLTPNAAGREKADEYLVTQGNKALMIFEESVKVEAGRRGVEHLGTWNMSVQSNKFDG